MSIETMYIGARVGDVILFEQCGTLFRGIVVMRIGSRYRVRAEIDGAEGNTYRFTVLPGDIVQNITARQHDKSSA